MRDSQNYVNASMVIKASASDTSVSYFCDWQYSQLQNDVNKLDDKAEYFAIFFMNLDKEVFGHTKFTITDKSLFRSNGKSPREIEFKNKDAKQNVKTDRYVEYCQEVTVSYTTCAYIGHCYGPGGSCDNCHVQCTSWLSYNYCWEEWISDGSTGDGSGGTGTGGGGPGGGPTPPEPCDGGYGSQSASIGSSVIRTLRAGCNDDPGWEPIIPPPCPIIRADLKLAFPSASDEILHIIVTTINQYGEKFGLDTKEKIAYFLGQAAAESGPSFVDMFKTEYNELNRMTVTNLLDNYKRFFSLTDPNKKNPNDYIHQPEKLANLVYGPETDLGNDQPGDGFKYIGRGFLQTTGKYNYQQYKDFYNQNFNDQIDPVANPDLLISNHKNSILSALFYFKKRVLAKVTINANTDIDKVSEKVNAGKKSRGKRRDYTNAALAHINCH